MDMAQSFATYEGSSTSRSVGGGVVSDYRAFWPDAAGHVVRRIDFEAANDAQALQVAQQHVGESRDVEVWQLGRVVGKLNAVARQLPH
jgi:hypothetical protein